MSEKKHKITSEPEIIIDHSEKLKSSRFNSLSSILFLFFILLGVVGIGSFNYFYYLEFKELKAKVSSYENTFIQANKSIELNTTDNKLLSNDFNNLKNFINTTNTKILELQDTLNTIKGEQRDPELKTKLLNISNLINLADAKLKYENNINTAREILASADNYLKNNKEQELVNLRKAIIKYSSRLDQIEVVDTLKLNSYLEEIENTIDNITVLDLIADTRSAISTVEVKETNSNLINITSSNWQDLLNNLKADLMSLIKVRKVSLDDQQLMQLLDNEQVLLIKLYFKLKLAEAATNLNNRDSKVYNNVINNLIKNTNRYFTNNSQLKERIVNLLQLSQASELKPDLPDLSEIYDLTGDRK